MLGRALAAGCLLIMAAGCRDKAPTFGAVRVVVEYPDFTPGCVQVTARDAEGPGITREDLSREQLSRKKRATIAVYRAEGWSERLHLEVTSFEGTCAGDPLETHGTGDDALAVTAEAGVLEWTAVLRAKDADGDGYPGRVEAQGVLGADCDDADPNRNPGADEICFDTVDLDCNGLRGCDDPACSACEAPPPCHLAAGAVCADSLCAYPKLAAGTACEHSSGAGRCAETGQCISESEFCLDCSQDGCEGLTCTDGDACTDGDTCTAAGACVGAARVCEPDACHTSQCVNGACEQSPTPGLTCAAPTCIDVPVCSSAGVCEGTNLCTSPPACHQPLGQCGSDGLCSYQVAVGAGCDDGQACTHSDGCAANGTCAGTSYSCPQPVPPCELAIECAGDGTCVTLPNKGVPCTAPTGAGFCAGDATCFAPPNALPFPYLPSNFNQADFAIQPPLVISGDCQAGFVASTTGATAGTFTVLGGTCPTNWPVPVVAQLSNGRSVWVIAVSGLEIASTAILALYEGDRPVIIAVYGNVLLNGAVYANSSFLPAPGRGGPGAAWDGCGSGAGQDAAATTGRGGGGGGGGFQQAGADAGVGDVGGARNLGGIGGVAVTATREPLGAGCAGGRGAGGSEGAGAPGGGALQISAAGYLHANAIVSVSGAGGRGAAGNDSGGGGGGSGGMLVLEGNTVTLATGARLTSNGGAGGAGAKGNQNAATIHGGNGSTSSATAATGGVSGDSEGGPGGAGGAGLLSPAVGGNGANRGGGGGGGGTGFVFVRAHQTGAGSCTKDAIVTSPAPTYLGGCN